MSNDYEVSCPELDFLVDLSRDKNYILGSRMMGGGFDECTLNIIKKEHIEEFLNEVTAIYQEKFSKDPTPIRVSIEDGSSRI